MLVNHTYPYLEFYDHNKKIIENKNSSRLDELFSKACRFNNSKTSNDLYTLIKTLFLKEIKSFAFNECSKGVYEVTLIFFSAFTKEVRLNNIDIIYFPATIQFKISNRSLIFPDKNLAPYHVNIDEFGKLEPWEVITVESDPFRIWYKTETTREKLSTEASNCFLDNLQ